LAVTWVPNPKKQKNKFFYCVLSESACFIPTLHAGMRQMSRLGMACRAWAWPVAPGHGIPIKGSQPSSAHAAPSQGPQAPHSTPSLCPCLANLLALTAGCGERDEGAGDHDGARLGAQQGCLGAAPRVALGLGEASAGGAGFGVLGFQAFRIFTDRTIERGTCGQGRFEGFRFLGFQVWGYKFGAKTLGGGGVRT
jgi:hypothetical protein